MTKLFKIHFLITVTLLLTFLPLASRAQSAGEEDIIPGGALTVITEESGEVKEFPLKHTNVQAEVSGYISRVTVTQEFVNPHNEPIEAVYVFPLPQNAAVDAMEMKIGERTIVAEIKTREEARQLYEEAKESGRRAGLLEQERPNIFTQSVANILPGDTILITIKYIETLEYVDGTYSFVFPMTVGPRYIPFGGVPDATRINPPVLKPGERSGHDISLSVNLDAGLEIQKITAANHQIEITKTNANQALITLSPFDAIPNKDFVLNYRVGGEKPQFTLLTHREPGADHGYFTLIAQPQLDPAQSEITPKEMVFVVDSSGSMSGEPISRVKQAMRFALKNMNPDDTFYLFSFANEVQGLSASPLPNSPENVEKGIRYINDLAGGGGTQMLKGIKTAYKIPRDPERLRYVIFLTDGYIGNEDEILSEIQAQTPEARLFSFGIGSSPNRFLIERMAEVGRGLPFFLNLTENSDKVITNFYERIANPVLTDITVNWEESQVLEVYPAPIQDLFSAKPLYLNGQYRGSGQATITIDGLVRGNPSETRLTITFPKENPANEGLASIWARQKVKSLMNTMYRGEDNETVKVITQLALAYNIVTKYTSFVAVEEKVVTDRPGQTVRVPVELPEGASYEGIFGEMPREADIGQAYAPSLKLGGGAPPRELGLGAATFDIRDQIRRILIIFGSTGILIVALIVTIILLIRRKKKSGNPPDSQKTPPPPISPAANNPSPEQEQNTQPPTNL